ncbi:MAG: M23 family metallopeptidase [Bacteroidales bacterium]|nr:M23 family metallopeptidase [Bacteroidales bacterium]
MAKEKFRYNNKLLTYEKVSRTPKVFLYKIISFLSVGLVFAVGVIVFAYNFFDSPKEKMQQREIEQLKLQYSLLIDKLDRVSLLLDDMQDRDDNIYRVIFEAEPIPSSIRKAGYGGVDRYARLDGYKNSEILIEASKKLDKITSQLYVQSKSFDQVFELAKNKEKMLVCIPAIQPIEKGKGRIVSGFGMRFHPILKYDRMHTGIDISAPTGTPIYATADGEIYFQGRNGTYGKCCIINHGYGYKTLYGHMNKIIVKRKQKVKRGQIIGYVGNTGLSRAPHIHYEVIKNNVKINPINYFYNDFTLDEYEKVLELASKNTQVLS